jgi:ribosome-associated toxin RatA of RatAB toxin-antitoxin module
LSKLNFELNVDANKTILEKLFTDYEYYSNYLVQIESVEIIKKNDDEIITKEVLVFSTYLKNKITQTSSHKINDNVYFSEILDGPAKGTIVKVKFLAEDLKTKIIIDVELKLSLKAKIFYPIIKKAYKQFLIGIFLKMNTRAIQIE